MILPVRYLCIAHLFLCISIFPEQYFSVKINKEVSKNPLIKSRKIIKIKSMYHENKNTLINYNDVCIPSNLFYQDKCTDCQG